MRWYFVRSSYEALFFIAKKNGGSAQPLNLTPQNSRFKRNNISQLCCAKQDYFEKQSIFRYSAYIQSREQGTITMKACATASGGVIFIPEKIVRKKCKPTNDNTDRGDISEEA